MRLTNLGIVSLCFIMFIIGNITADYILIWS